MCISKLRILWQWMGYAQIGGKSFPLMQNYHLFLFFFSSSFLPVVVVFFFFFFSFWLQFCNKNCIISLRISNCFPVQQSVQFYGAMQIDSSANVCEWEYENFTISFGCIYVHWVHRSVVHGLRNRTKGPFSISFIIIYTKTGELW